MLLSIVVPVFREEKNIPEFLRRIRPILGEITQDYEIIFSMDPSPDRTEEVVLEERLTDPRIKLLKFSRRFGQPMATLAGMEYSRGDAVIVMDVDLQDRRRKNPAKHGRLSPNDAPRHPRSREAQRIPWFSPRHGSRRRVQAMPHPL